MIAPSSRLLRWSAVAVVPCAVAGVAAPGAGLLAAVVAAGCAGLALLDAALSLGRLEGVAAEVDEVARLSKGHAGLLGLRLRGAARALPRLRVGLAVPRPVGPDQEQAEIALPADGRWHRVDWPCTPRERGRYALEACHVEAPSALGLWSVRRCLAVRGEVRVYPDLRAERKRVSAVFLRRGPSGRRLHRQVGRGREFEKLREYQPGDAYEDIHWKATAKRRHPVTKLFRIERTQEVYCLVDASRLSARPADPLALRGEDGAAPPTVLERYLATALMLGVAAHQQGDLFGLITFGSRVERSLKAGLGSAHFNACRDLIYTLQPARVSPDFAELCSFVRLNLRKRALLVFLTSLDDPVLAEQFVEAVRLICRQHLVLVMTMKPEGAQPLFTNARVEQLDDVYRALGGHALWQKLRGVEKDLARHGVRMVQAPHERLAADLVSQYMEIKAKQLI